MDEKENKLKIHKKSQDKLPFAVFISPKDKNKDDIEDFKEIFTDIISNRIKEKFNIDTYKMEVKLEKD